MNRKLAPLVNSPNAPTTPTIHCTTISRFLCNVFPRMAPQFFCQYDSPSNMAESWYARRVRGRFPNLLFGRFPNQKPRGKGPPSKHLVQILREGFLPPESWLGDLRNRKPPRGGGFPTINFKLKHTKTAQEALWMRSFDPGYNLLFGLYH